jgi:hypothetical protein
MSFLSLRESSYRLFISVEYFFFAKKIEAVLQLDVGFTGRRDRQREIPKGIKRHAAVTADSAL